MQGSNDDMPGGTKHKKLQASGVEMQKNQEILIFAFKIGET